MTFHDSLLDKGWTFDGEGWTGPDGEWFETDREACAYAERGNASAYDSNYDDEWE